MHDATSAGSDSNGHTASGGDAIVISSRIEITGSASLFGCGLARGAGEPGRAIVGDRNRELSRCLAGPRNRGNNVIVIRDEKHPDRQTSTAIVRGRRWIDDPMKGRAPAVVGPAHHQIAEVDR